MSVVKNPFQVSRDYLSLTLPPLSVPPACVTFNPLLCPFPQCLHPWLLEQSLLPPLNGQVSGRDRGDLDWGDRGVKKPDGCLAPGHSSEPRSQAHEPQEVGSAGAPAPSSDRQSVLMLTSEAQPDPGNFEGLLELNSCQAASASPISPPHSLSGRSNLTHKRLGLWDRKVFHPYTLSRRSFPGSHWNSALPRYFQGKNTYFSFKNKNNEAIYIVFWNRHVKARFEKVCSF